MLMKPQVLRMLEYQDSVSHHDTDQADNAQDARLAEIDMERPQAQRRPEQGEQQRGQAANAKPIFLKLTNRKKKTMITAIAKPCISGFIVSKSSSLASPYSYVTPSGKVGIIWLSMTRSIRFCIAFWLVPRVTSAKTLKVRTPLRRTICPSFQPPSIVGDLPERDAHAGDDGGKILVADLIERVTPPLSYRISAGSAKRNRLPRGSNRETVVTDRQIGRGHRLRDPEAGGFHWVQSNPYVG